MRSPLGSYLPGDTLLHRLRPGAKLVGLFVFATAAIALRSVPSTVAALVIAVALAATAGLRPREFGRVARGFAWVAVPLFAFQAWQSGWERGFAVVGTLLALILAASAFTATTATSDVTDTITWALHPLRRFGADPDRVALAFSLVIRAIPSVLGIAAETRAAARARGLERSPRAYIVPLVLRTVAHAQQTGAALQARGIGEEEAPPARSPRATG
ncbi:energy-coupling factor transporter transmembrane protein EcfT [Leucobacter sp. CSA1]|uniref:Energy-coupling factor transporter transmembrane protein EcfT n=1 Tax=Leucobacter chromiisoli TaxID=2796471 RepID=A0A934UVD9_9MICO|nr:CbiQ family ECF transporter T component [Leucobacter chromiisoli]MBK0419810.1 energy-coupling factor transporter transmembrane protein EcfT [Leucobacter chromiisoli]